MSNLPARWTWTTLGEASAKPQYGWTTKANGLGSGLQLLRTTDITSGSIDWSRVPFCTVEPDKPDQYLLAADDIVVSRAGSVGASIRVIAPPPAVFASYLIRLRARSGIEPSYLAWFLKSPRYWSQISEAAAGIALLNVNARKLAAISMPLAPLNEQRRIVGAIEEQFSRLDAAEGSASRSTRRLDGFARAVLRASIDDRRSPLVSLADLAVFVTDGDHNPPKRVSTGIPHLTAKHVKRGRLSTDRCTFVSETGFERTRKRYEPRPGDVIVTCVGTIGESAVVPKGLVFSADRNLAAIRLAPSADPDYVRLALSTPRARRLMGNASGSTAQPHLYLRDLRALEIPLPAVDDQRRIVAELERQLSLVDAMRAAIETVQRRSTALRRAILDRAFRGELVPQDPSDEPATVLLERIRAESAASAPARRPSRRRSASSPR